MVHVWHLALFGNQFVPGVEHLNWGLSPKVVSLYLKIQQPQIKPMLLAMGRASLASHSLSMNSMTESVFGEGSAETGSSREQSSFVHIQARDKPNSRGIGGSRVVRFVSAQSFPSQMVDIEEQERFRILAAKLLKYTLFPALGEIRFRVHLLGEEAVLMGHAKEIEHRCDHIDVGHQDGLGQVFSEVFVGLGDSGPEPRHGLAQEFRVDLMEMRPHLEAFVDLVGFQLADGYATDQLSERFFTQPEVDIRNLH